MADNKFTPSQEYAINRDYGDLLVSAAAGSGKTFTLSKRIVELVKSGKADIEKILVVTFTRSAAADMKAKIAKALKKAAHEAKNGDHNEYVRLNTSANKTPSADISTIDSFLNKIVKRNLSELGIPQDSRLVSNESILNNLKTESMRETVNELFDKKDPIFLRLADILAAVRETENLDETLMSIANDLTGKCLEPSVLGEYADKLNSDISSADDFLSSDFGRPIKKVIMSPLTYYRNLFAEIEPGFLDGIHDKYSPDALTLIDWIDSVISTLERGKISDVLYLLKNATFDRVPQVRGGGDVSEMYRHYRDDFKKKVSALADKYSVFKDDDIIESKKQTVELLKMIEHVITVYFDKFRTKKRELSILDFNDLLRYSLILLTDKEGNPSDTALTIGKKYKYIFVDEYQDTNEVQDKIFRAISANSKRFMVGDIKQSIYRFRGAEPNVFSYYRENWEAIDPASDGDNPHGCETGNVLMMSNNFRSAEPVTMLTNSVSTHLMSHGGIPYTKGDELICSLKDGKNPSHPNSEVIVMGSPPKGERTASENTDDDDCASAVEIEYVAARIKNMVGTYLGEHIVKPEDIAILMRRKDKALLYKEALAKYNIPAVVANEFPLIKNPSVVLLMCIINFVDNPLRDVYTAGALRSPVFGFTSTDLVRLREFDKNKPLFICVTKCAESTEPEYADLKAKCIKTIEWLDGQKTISRGMIPSKYIEYLIEETDLFSISGIREDGNERNAVNRFCTMATTFEAASSSAYGRCDLSAFIEYAEENLEAGEKIETAASKSVENAVSIMTIHSSKGLEYPIVFVVGCGRLIRTSRDYSPSITFDKGIGFGMYLPDITGMAKCNTIFREAILASNLEASMNEEMRILYVAMSRAQTKLIITAQVRYLDSLVNNVEYDSVISDDYSVHSANSYIKWVLDSLKAIPSARTTTEIWSFETANEKIKELIGVREDGENIRTQEDRNVSYDYGERLRFEYEYGYLGNIPAMLTVTRLSPSILDIEGEEEPEEHSDPSTALNTSRKPSGIRVKLKKPNFMIGEISVSPTEKGNATHAFMQFVDYANLKKVGGEAELKRLMEKKYISAGYASVVNRAQIDRFASSAFIDKLMRTDLLEREFRFNIRMDAAELTTETSLREQYEKNDVKVNVTGVVDCIFRDPDTGELTVVDYKTDALDDEYFSDREKAAALLKERHTSQLSYYRKICEKIFLEEIPHVYIYSTVLGELIEI